VTSSVRTRVAPDDACRTKDTPHPGRAFNVGRRSDKREARAVRIVTVRSHTTHDIATSAAAM
jgi:hypothetical protein